MARTPTLLLSEPMTKIFFFDVDNTLLDHNTHAIPPSALSAIERIKHAGHTVVIATGRSFGHAKPFIEQVRPSYVITLNGACILKDGKEVLTIPLPRQPLLDLFDWMQGQGHYFGVNQGHVSYISAAVPSVETPLRSVKMPVQTDDPFYLDQDVYQGWLFFDESLDDILFPAIQERFPDFDLVRWHKTAVDVLPKAVNKWTGCQWVLAETGFQAHQAIAFGDGMNDMEMIKGVGIGIAMGNGHPELKAVADRVALPLHEDGIAIMLDELISARRLEAET